MPSTVHLLQHDSLFLLQEKKRDDDAKFKALKDAAYFGEIDKIPRLIRNGANMYRIDEALTGKTLIHLAAGQNQEAVIRTLYAKRSGKVYDPISDPRSFDVDHKNALHDAAVKGHVGPLKALVELKADLSNRDNIEGFTIVHRAAVNQKLEFLKTLKDLKADMDAKCFDKETSLHKASKLGLSEVT